MAACLLLPSAVRFVLFVMAIGQAYLVAAPVAIGLDNDVKLAEEIVDHAAHYQSDFQRLRQLAGNDRVLAALIAATSDMPADKHLVMLDIIATLGGEFPDPAARSTPRYRFIVSARVIDYFAGLLGSRDGKLRAKAATILSTRVVQQDIQSRAAKVLDAIATPESTAEYLLLGMTRRQQAAERLPELDDVEEVRRFARQVAAAMLGDQVAEKDIIDRFAAAQAPHERNELAMALAHINSPRAIRALAKGLRSPHVARWGGRGRQSFRLIVVASLSWAYPDAEVLWELRVPPTCDQYYESIERWAQEKFGIEWDRPRPPFLYQEYAPMYNE